MKIKAKYSIVAYKEYHSGPNGIKILDKSKCFRNRQDAQEYAAQLMDDPEAYKQQGDPGWIVVDMETILD